MYRNKKDVDKHVENLISKLSVKEFKTRAYSVARLYYEVGDYTSCQKYVEQYLTQKDNNAAAYKLLGQAMRKLGQKDKALEQYKTSLDIDPSQTSTILDICELLADDELVIEPGRAKFWCEKAEATFPRHPITFRLRERLVTLSDPDPEALVNLLTTELAIRPKDSLLHIRLLKQYLHTNQYKEAFEHSCNVEFSGNNFLSSYTWYEVLCELLNHTSYNINDWLYQLLLLTVRERICVLSLTETPSGISKSLVEANELLHTYDQAIEHIAKAGAPPGFGEFHASLLQHHRGQFALHAATFLLKKAKKDQLNWRDATKYAAPLMLIAWHTVPLDTKVNWLRHANEKQLNAVSRWYLEGTYRCSQSGHYLLSNNQDKNQSFLDRISQCCSGAHWRDKLYEKIFTTRAHLTKIKSSHLVSNAFSTPVLRLPRKVEVEAYDGDAQRQHGNSLHHFVWTLLNYKNYSHFKCTLFDMLKPSVSSSGPETLNKLDIHAFLFSAALTSRQQRSNEVSYVHGDKPCVIPANITDLLCPLYQLKWWDCAYKFSQNELGTELTDIRATLSRGIEVVRCIDNHGLDPELLCHLGRIFSEKAKVTTNIDEKNSLEVRSGLYYASAIPLLEKLKNKTIVKLPEKRLFDYTHKEISSKELNTLIEESKLYVAVKHFNDCEYDKVIETLSNLKSPQAYYHLSQAYNRIAFEENNSSVEIESKLKCLTLLSKAKAFAYKALDKLKETETNKTQPLYSDVQELIEDIETHLNKMDPELSYNMINDVDGKYSSDENVSNVNDHLQLRTNSRVYRNLSSTPKPSTNTNTTTYRSAIDSHILESTRVDHQFLERIENEIKNLQKRDTTINNFMEQTKDWFDENRKLGNQIISTINSNIQNTTDQFKLLKISVDQVKDQIDECRNECKDVGELKKQVAELKKEVSKLKKASSEPTIDENDLYNLDDEYRTNDSTSSFATQLPFATPQVMPPFNQRLVPPFPVPPNPYQLYGQSLYNLYNQYSQLAQPSSVPSAAPMFDPSRTQVNFPGVYSTPDQMYLEMPHLVQSTIPNASTMPVAPPIPTIPNVPVVSVPPSTVPTTKAIPKETKENSRSLPVNVVITSSDPLPTCTTTPAPILSVTIPPKHIKVTPTPHNYQIPMPSTNETKAISPPVFSFPMSGNKSSTASSITTWNQSSVFKTQSTPTTMTGTPNDPNLFSSKIDGEILDNSKSVVDGVFAITSPNTSLNKSRTLSERSNTSVENYDPCPDFKPIVPLPAEVKVTTGEENETVIFSSRAKLFRFVSKQWKERGLGEMKLLKHKITGKVRVLMRREQVHKICANHIISADMEIKPMKNETKAYFWVANDYADEVVVLEKFCIRFKTTDIAQKFYETFEKARSESADNANISKCESVSNTSKTSNLSTPVKDGSGPVIVTTSKAVIGGFTFSSTPSFKSIPDETKSDSKATEVTNKSNVFSGLTFKTTTNSPFSNLFNITPSQATDHSNIATNQETPNKLNTSDTVEEFEPNVDFKPVIPLPALVEQKTGEEDENILFEHRAKLLRFDALTKEWKERGLGCIKLLVQKDNINKLRLLMRREQIMKICCNHAVTKDMFFQKMPNMDKAVTWCAKDFSDGELVAETFCLRFKTVQVCDDFVKAIETAQSKMNNDSKAAKEEQNATKQNAQSGFGDKFKSKPGAWSCDTCYTNNLENYDKCACCEQPKPQNEVLKTSITSTKSDWGKAFKPKPGTWECQQCFVRNEANLESCNACSSPKDPSKVKPASMTSSDSPQQFKFGIITQNSNDPPKVTTPALTPKSGWGDKFKPKEGTWECKQCFVRNEANKEQCSACNSSKDPNAVKKDTQSIFGNASGQKFNFGIPATLPTEHKPQTETSSIFDGTGAHKFSFGIPKVPSIANFGDTKTAAASIFGASNTTAENENPLNVSKNTDDDIKTVTPVKPALLPTPQADASNASFGGKSGTFDFVFKPKTPTKGKSPIKSPKGQGEEDSDGNEYASEDDGVHIHFSPVVPMPDKVEVVTGEENETELYGHRAKLFRFISGEWKERGIGVVKILKHKDTGKLRVVMRREQVLKICLNHALTNEIIYTSKDEKTWLFVANDFSEGEISLQHFCIRFKSKEIASDFKDAIDKARGGQSDQKEPPEINRDDNDSDDIVFVSEIQATTEEKQKAKDLMLPENFFTYKNKEPCRGCRGCKTDDDLETNVTAVASAASVINKNDGNQSTPIKSSVSIFQSPTSSVYGTPASLDKTADTSIFRTPLTSIGSNTKSLISTNLNNVIGNDGTNKENTLSSKPSLFSGFSDQKIKFGTPLNNPASLFGGGDTSVSTNTKSSLIAPPKLSSLNTSSETQNPEPKSIFASAQSKSIFSETKSVFGDAASVFGSKTTEPGNNKQAFEFKKGENQNSEFKSIFGAADQKPVNLFSGVSQGSIFGPGVLTNQSKSSMFGSSVFGSSATPAQSLSANTNQSQAFEGKSIFATNPASFWSDALKDKQTPDLAATNVASDQKIEEVKVDPNPVKKEALFSVDKDLSFAALSSGKGPDFAVQKKPDFKWEGAGQQLFTAAQRTPSKDAGDISNVESGAGDETEGGGAEEDYDPHYEPIVPLPDKIVVTTGEEDEEKLFGERCKLYRYDDKSREWKERGVGEMKILYHPHKNTYRLLLRREQVHKAVLNMLLFMDLELLPMKNSDRAWTWAGRNYAEIAAGEQETLAVRFKSVDLATAFHDKIVDCVRKLQAAAAKAVRDVKKAEKPFETVAPLRLPKHLEDSARADNAISARFVPQTSMEQSVEAKTDSILNGEMNKPSTTDMFKQVHFQEPKEEEHEDEDDEDEEDYEHDYDNADYEAYYNEEEEESAVYYTCDGEVVVREGESESESMHGHIKVLFDQRVYSPKILVTDLVTGETIADMLIHTDTEFKMSGDSCSWSGMDFASDFSVPKTVSVNFYDADSALQFYDSCETSKAAAYSSTDPET